LDRPGFQSQHVPTFYPFSNCPEPLQGYPVFCSSDTGRFNREQNGWCVMLTTAFYLKIFKRTRQKLTGKKIVELDEQPALGNM
jgi:hypothetical protein